MNAPRVAVLDAGGANLASVTAAFERLGVTVRATRDRGCLDEATHLVLPGVGAAGSAMRSLRDSGLDRWLSGSTQPLLGICIGMQLLYERSEEGDTTCLGLLPGVVGRLRATPSARIPHMGWNRLRNLGDDPLTAGIDGEHAYFVHSFAAPSDPELTRADCEHGERFAAVVSRGRIAGTQFHPERSGATGARLLKNFLGLPA